MLQLLESDQRAQMQALHSGFFDGTFIGKLFAGWCVKCALFRPHYISKERLTMLGTLEQGKCPVCQGPIIYKLDHAHTLLDSDIVREEKARKHIHG